VTGPPPKAPASPRGGFVFSATSVHAHIILMAMQTISVVQLGTVDYATALQLQQTLVELRKDGQVGDVLLLLEHPPVITLGRNAQAQNVTASPELLARKGVELFECDRGGDVTFHGPGQLVGYPIFDLRGLTPKLGAVDYVRRLEEVLIRTCADFGIGTERVAKMTGVWVREEAGLRPAMDGSETRPYTGVAEGKIAAIGVHIARGVTSHGFALNVNTDLDFFNLIIPCGIATKPVTSMSKQLGRALPLEEVAQAVTRNFGRVFNSQILWVETLDALLGREVDVPARAPEELRKVAGEEETFWA
jgi:lipoyl(octanoyl) transferase